MTGTVFRLPIFLLIAALTLPVAACNKKADNQLQGWIEADLIFVSPDEQGRVETLTVRDGDHVEKDALLAALDSDLQRADLAVAEAAFTNAKQAFERAQQLLRTGTGTPRDFDTAQAGFRQTQAQLAAAQTRLSRRRLTSPVTGLVQQVYYRPGETVPAGRPIVSLLPPGNVKVRFFVPETLLARIAIGDGVKVACDGCPAGIGAKITFISRNAEFTPPVIYSLEERSKLVFMVEARPEQSDALRVGQPVSVEIEPREVPK